MSQQKRCRGSGWFLGLTMAGVLTTGLAAAQPARASGKLDSSVKFVPSDAAFYGSMLHGREQVEAITNSHAWAKLKALPAVKQYLHMAREELKKPTGQLAPLVQLYQQPENRQLLELLADMGSEEIFFYGGQSWVGFTDLALQATGAVRFGPVLAALSGKGVPADPSQAQAIALLTALSENRELIKVPDLIIGFRLSKPDQAGPQLERLHTLLKEQLQHVPELKGSLKRRKVAGGDFLTFTVTGKLVPWDQIPIKDYEEKPGQFDDVVKKLKDLKLTVAVGVRDDYLLVSLGESTDLIAKLGEGQSLSERPEFKPLAKFAGKRITAIDYLSKDLASKLGTTRRDIDELLDAGHQLLKQADLPERTRTQIQKDLNDFAKDMKSFIHDSGAIMAFSFLTERGQEGYVYDWGAHPTLDGSKPLTLLNHVGGDPLLAVVGRTKYAPENYRMLVKWIKVGNRYFEELALPKFEEAQKEQYEQVAKILHPLLRRLDEVTSKMLLPALADGQSALVLDAKITSKHWIQTLPATKKALPMLEPALVFGVSDATLLRQAFEEYRSIANDTIAKIREMLPIFPAFEIPLPETRKVKGGTLYYYPIPEAAGLDPQILPNAGLSDHVVVLSASPKQSEGILAKTPLRVEGGPLADASKPRASAVYVNWPGLVDAAAPWVEYGVEQSGVQRELDAATAKDGKGGKGWGNALAQIRTVMEVMKVLRSVTSASYLEDGVLVTHSETVFHDLK